MLCAGLLMFPRDERSRVYQTSGYASRDCGIRSCLLKRRAAQREGEELSQVSDANAPELNIGWRLSVEIRDRMRVALPVHAVGFLQFRART